VAALLALMLAQLLYGWRTDGMTGDEVVYIGAGYRHLHGDFSLNPEQPPLAKLLGALPLLGMPLQVPEVRPTDDQDGWSHRFVHEANRGVPLLVRARVPAILMCLGLALLIWIWARLAAGPLAGLVALTAAAFQPSFLAHGHLVTTDLPGAFTTLLASFAFWRYLERPAAGRSR